MRVVVWLRSNHEAAREHSVKIMRGLECLAALGRALKTREKDNKATIKRGPMASDLRSVSCLHSYIYGSRI